MLVVIASRLGSELARHHAADDVWQEALLHAWRDRESCEWRGVTDFRRWLLSVIDNRIRDLAEHEGAMKRGGGRTAVAFSVMQGGREDTQSWQWAGPAQSTTPSLAAMAAERAAAMQEALDGLPDELREVVHLRLFEGLQLQEVADRVGIGLSAVAHRFRKGAAEYGRILQTALATRSRGVPG